MLCRNGQKFWKWLIASRKGVVARRPAQFSLARETWLIQTNFGEAVWNLRWFIWYDFFKVCPIWGETLPYFDMGSWGRSFDTPLDMSNLRHLLWNAFRLKVQKLTLLGCSSGWEQSFARYLTRWFACSLLLYSNTFLSPGLQVGLQLNKRGHDWFLWGFTAFQMFVREFVNPGWLFWDCSVSECFLYLL